MKNIVVNENGRISGFRLATMQTRKGRGPEAFPADRKCECCGCNLSVYNKYQFCAQCQNLDVRARRMKEKV